MVVKKAVENLHLKQWQALPSWLISVIESNGWFMPLVIAILKRKLKVCNYKVSSK